ncbi:MAG TPA: LptF/LptG family permease [Myxococcota bacterium]|nr:LptF/LptG family permease [Myxococcota bacterium]
MRTLSRYFVQNYLTYYAAIVAASILVIAIVEMMVNFDHVIEYGEGVAGVASYLFLRLPSYYLPYLLPVGSFGAAFLCLGFPARALEILAARTSGIAPQRIAAPVLAAACLLSGVALFLNETVVLRAARRFDRGQDGGELFQARGEFWYRRGNTLFNVQGADRDTQTLQGVAIYERDAEGRLLRSVRADRAHIETDRRWRLENALFREFPRGEPDSAPRTEALPTAMFEVGDAGDLALLGADPHELPLWSLHAYILAVDAEGRDTTRYRSLWHARLADPLTVLLFAVLGAPLGFSVERARSLGAAAIHGVGLLAGYYALQTTASVIGSAGYAASVLAPWAVLGGFGAFGAWRFARVGG